MSSLNAAESAVNFDNAGWDDEDEELVDDFQKKLMEAIKQGDEERKE